MTEYKDFPLEAALGAEAESADRSLAKLAEQVAACNPRCCGASVTAVPAGAAGTGAPRDAGGRAAEERSAARPPQTAVTHPDLTPLVTAQWEAGEGPIPAAIDTGLPAASEDLLHDERWPRYRARALEAGVRSCLTLPFRRQVLTVTVTLYGFRPGRLEDPRHGPAALLGSLAASGIVRDLQHRRMREEIDQLDTALHSRPVVDQACGIIMYVLGCDAETAFALLRRMSQRTNRKLYELAEALVRTRGHGAEEEIVRLGGALAGHRGKPPPRAGGGAGRGAPGAHGRMAAAHPGGGRRS